MTEAQIKVQRNWVRLVWAAVMMMAMSVMVGASGAIYTSHVQRQADQRWCDLFATLDVPVPQTIKDPVQRARSERAQRQFHQLRVDLGCVKK